MSHICVTDQIQVKRFMSRITDGNANGEEIWIKRGIKKVGDLKQDLN